MYIDRKQLPANVNTQTDVKKKLAFKTFYLNQTDSELKLYWFVASEGLMLYFYCFA